MSKLYYRLKSLCVFLKQEKIIDDYDISHLKLVINEKQLSYDYDTLRLKFENDNKIFEKYKDCFILLDETLNKTFTDKYKSFNTSINEYEEEYEKIKNELEKLTRIDLDRSGRIRIDSDGLVGFGRTRIGSERLAQA
jgi:hypothetical protein